MSNRVALLYSTASGAIPDATQLMVGELVVNIVDGRLYTKDTGSNILLLAGGGPQVSASYALTASYASVTQTVSASYALTSSYSSTASFAQNAGTVSPTGSFTGSFTGSILGSASYALTSSYATTASYAATVLSASYAGTASLLLGSVVSASYALTASYAQNAAGGTSSLGKHTIWIPASALIPRVLSGSYPVVQIQLDTPGTGSNHISMDFTGSVMQYAQFYVAFPRSWDKSSVTSRFYWSHTSSVTNFNVIWGIHALPLFNSASMTGSFAAGSEITGSGGIVNYLYVTSETTNITVGSPDNNSMMAFELYRSASKGTTADNLAVNARLLGIQLLYTTNASIDN